MKDDTKKLDKVVHIDETRIQDHLGEMVRGTVEETLNAMLDAEADHMSSLGSHLKSSLDSHFGSLDS